VPSCGTISSIANQVNQECTIVQEFGAADAESPGKVKGAETTEGEADAGKRALYAPAMTI
jgi:hypothetical protein